MKTHAKLGFMRGLCSYLVSITPELSTVRCVSLVTRPGPYHLNCLIDVVQLMLCFLPEEPLEHLHFATLYLHF